MIEFPSTTAVNRILPKDKFVEHLDLTPNLKKKLISDVVHIKILNKFSKSVLGFREDGDFKDPFRQATPATFPTFVGAGLDYTNEDGGFSRCAPKAESCWGSCHAVTEGVLSLKETITEVLLLQIDLKKPDFDSKLIEVIARQNPHKLVFLLRFQHYAKLAVYYKKLYIGSWKPFEEVTLTLNGNNMNEVWLSFVGQIALYERGVVGGGKKQRPLSSLSATLPPAKLGADLLPRTKMLPHEGGGAGEQSETEGAALRSNAVTEGVLTKVELDCLLDLQNKAESLKKEIAKLESAIRKEKQPKRKFELHKQLLEVKGSLESVAKHCLA